MSGGSLSEDDWEYLLQDIDDGLVIPVVGPGLLTMTGHDGTSKPLYDMLAPALMTKLGLSAETSSFQTTKDVAAAYILSGGPRYKVYGSMRRLLRSEEERVKSEEICFPTALEKLAKIYRFPLYIATTPDHFIEMALEKFRLGFRRDANVKIFHPAESPDMSDLPTQNLSGAWCYKLFGDFDPQRARDFVASDEDLMEFMVGLIANSDKMRNIINFMRRRSLLFLGMPAYDWTVLFLLRIVRGMRLSVRDESSKGEYISDHNNMIDDNTILFFQKAMKTTRIIFGDPVDFVHELHHRWSHTYGAAADQQYKHLLRDLPASSQYGSVFISYKREDAAIAVTLAHALWQANVRVWLDTQRLEPGEKFDETIESMIRIYCILFVSLISVETEKCSECYVHKERLWASERQGTLSTRFYLPFLWGDITADDVKLEPENIDKRHYGVINDRDLPSAVSQIVKLYNERRGCG
ncbi:toll/interleukin-1 receptor domain-containing protein (plasmid) [Tistrella mobilis]|uniref:toll/interleukin-1 receptor domain-containing protein n=1 Tax=Tistrella mobilis TaxID=171437 RepID=UPI0018D45A93|nr:toll/interleukin-1 receptor domain-containing protein [Tistrella mobilis]